MNFILTGGHSGIGLELTKMLLAEGHHLGLIVRNERRKADAIKTFGSSDQIHFFFADLSKQAAIKEVAKTIKSFWTTLDGLFNNAGVLLDQPYYSDQGNELHFEVNTLAPYLLTKELKPILDKAEAPFVVNTVTGGMHNVKKLDVDDLKQPKKFVKLLGSYMNSKMALVVLMNQLAEEWPNIRIVNVDPGPNKTKMTSGAGMPGWLKPVRNLLFAKPTKGAVKLYNGGFKERFTKKSGIYLTNNSIKPIKLQLSDLEMNKMKAAIN